MTYGVSCQIQNEANLSYLAQKARFEQTKQQLVSDVVQGWFDVVFAQQLLDLYKRREENAKQNLDIIESGYRQGINEALDVYLARNELNNERSRIATQIASLSSAARVLERLLGEYPKELLQQALTYRLLIPKFQLVFLQSSLPESPHYLPVGMSY